MTKFNTVDQWSETIQILRSKRYQRDLALYCETWATEEKLTSNDELLDDVLTELCVRNKADLFDYDKIYIDLEKRSITSDLKTDTRHQMGRLLAKAKVRPKQRLQARQVNFYMWVCLARKCREARRRAN